jgi:UTP--glucose-1-phosphate uridylyltransferase
MKVTTAVITAAGFGSRMLPVTAAVQKELLPILDRPVVDYIVRDCIAAGITKIIFVISPGSHGLQDYYVGNQGLESHLARFGKTAAIEELKAIHASATFNFVEQPKSAGYGTAVPLAVAASHLPTGEAFVVTNGDAFVWHSNGHSETHEMVKTFNEADADGAIMTLEKPSDELHHWGVLDVEQRAGRHYLTNLVEKPTAAEAPSNFISLFNFIFTPQIMPYVHAVKPNETGERYLTDAVLAASKRYEFVVHEATGQFLDSGNLRNWLQANQVVAQSRPELQEK